MNKILGVPVEEINSRLPLGLQALRYVSQKRDDYGVTFQNYRQGTHEFTVFECSPCVKAAAEVAFFGTAIASTLETLASAISLLFLKGMNQCVSDKVDFENKYVIPVRDYTINSFIATNVGFASLLENFRCAREVVGISEGDVSSIYSYTD